MPTLTPQQLNARKAGETAETNGFGSQERPWRPGGLYRLKDKEGNVVDEIICKTHPKFGDSQAAALERVGYEFVRPAEKGEIKEIEITTEQLALESKSGQVTQDDLKGALARINAVEKENEELKAQLAANSAVGVTDHAATTQAKEEAKAEAEAKVAERSEPTEADLRPETETPTETPEETPTETPSEPEQGDLPKGGGEVQTSETKTNKDKEGK